MSITSYELPLTAAGGLERLRNAVARQLALRGRCFNPGDYQRVVACAHLGRHVAAAYQRAPVVTSTAVPAYDALRAETERQFRLLTDPPSRGGLGFCVKLREYSSVDFDLTDEQLAAEPPLLP